MSFFIFARCLTPSWMQTQGTCWQYSHATVKVAPASSLWRCCSTGLFHTPAAAISFFEQQRVNPESSSTLNVQSCDCASQRRFLEYFAQLSHWRRTGQTQKPPRVVRIRQIKLSGLADVRHVDVVGFAHPRNKTLVGERRSGAVVSYGEGEDNQPSEYEDACAQADKDDDSVTDEAVLMEARHSLFRRQLAFKSEGTEMTRSKSARDASTFGSFVAGSKAVTGRPVFSSSCSSGMNSRIRASFPTLFSGVWELDDTELMGEFRIEIHRRLKKADREQHSKNNEGNQKHFFGRGASRAQTLAQSLGFKRELILACWLHTDFLDQDEPPQDLILLRRQNHRSVTVELGRFGLDKAAHAPGLRSYLTGLKLQIEFDVEARCDMGLPSEPCSAIPFGLLSDMHVSEAETLNWLTFVVRQMWPHFENSFRQLMEDKLIPLIRSSLPPPFQEARLSSFSLGDAFPMLGPIVASSRHHEGQEVQLTIGLNYETDTDIIVETSVATFSITHLKLRGTLCLKFTPILSQLPVLCAMQLFFLNKPVIEFRFGRSLELANLAIIRDRVHHEINESISGLLLLPNVLNINWGDPSAASDSTTSWQSVLPCAIMRLSVKGACGLRAGISILGQTGDPLVKVSVGSENAETSTAAGDRPVWDEVFDFMVYDLRQDVHIAVYNKEMVGSGIIAQARTVTVADIVAAGRSGIWFDLEDILDKTSSSQLFVLADLYDLNPSSQKIKALTASEISPVSPSQRSTTAAIQSHILSPFSFLEGASDFVEAWAKKPIGHARATVLLVCEVFGGSMLVPDVAPASVELQVNLGQANGKLRCEEALRSESDVLLGKYHTIQSLAAMRLSTEAIAEALGETPEDVQRILREHGWNLRCPRKICALVYPRDLASGSSVDIVVFVKGKQRAKGTIPLTKIIAAENAMTSEVITCWNTHGAAVMKVDLKVGLYALEISATHEDSVVPETFEDPVIPETFKVYLSV
ncbi:unnamed protein product [Polarella glacialis]|uniref:C2 domain-containing protein n=1 Tax=Polarella glacialis TaxID=89957 RepID=A0A813IJ57_POLGL|nr:unnamed protein product [Polarella glacialis]